MISEKAEEIFNEEAKSLGITILPRMNFPSEKHPISGVFYLAKTMLISNIDEEFRNEIRCFFTQQHPVEVAFYSYDEDFLIDYRKNHGKIRFASITESEK